MIILFDNKQIKYTYLADREYKNNENSFLKNTLQALDYIYKHNLLVLSYKHDNLIKKINIIDVLVSEEKEPIYIKQGTKNQYHPQTNTIYFYDTHGISFRKDYKKRFTTKNIGFNSPVSLLSHEIIHCFHELYDTNNYQKRRKNQLTKGKKITAKGSDLSFSNKEEELVVRLTNQVARKLNEDIRRNYGRSYYKVKNVFSTEKDRLS